MNRSLNKVPFPTPPTPPYPILFHPPLSLHYPALLYPALRYANSPHHPMCNLLHIPYPSHNQAHLITNVIISLCCLTSTQMNIFCLYNTLWGLARMKVDTNDLGPELTALLLQSTMTILHSFLPEQYGDVMWSLGTLGITKRDFTSASSDRLLAILSRVYGKLHVRAAAYTLWGLHKIGYVWGDMRKMTRSVVGGREAPPLAGDSCCIYLVSYRDNISCQLTL